MGNDLNYNCLPDCLVCHAPLAAKLCLQNFAQLVDFCTSWFAGTGNCIAYGEQAKLEDGHTKPGGSVKV